MSENNCAHCVNRGDFSRTNHEKNCVDCSPPEYKNFKPITQTDKIIEEQWTIVFKVAGGDTVYKYEADSKLASRKYEIDALTLEVRLLENLAMEYHDTKKELVQKVKDLELTIRAKDDEISVARNTITDLTKEIDEHPYCTGGCRQCKHRGHCYGEDAVKLFRKSIDEKDKEIESLKISASAREAYYEKIDKDRVATIIDRTATIRKLEAKLDEASVVEFIDHDKCDDQ